MNTSKMDSIDITHSKNKSSKTRKDCLRLVLDGAKRCINPTIDQEEVAALRAELDSALNQLEEERLQVEALLEEKEADEERHFREIGKLVDEKMRAVFENNVLKDHLARSREYYKEGAKELNDEIGKLHKAYNGLAEDHKTLRRKYAFAASERKSWMAQVEQSCTALQEASTAKKHAEEELALQRAQTDQYRSDADTLARKVEDQKRGAEELQSKIRQMSSEIIRTKSDLSESERVKECLINDSRAQGILLDSLWAHVYDPSRRSLPIVKIEQLRDERETLISTVEAKDLVIDDLSFRLAVATPLPADGCSTTELLIVDLSNRVEELAGQLSTSEEKVSGLTLEVCSLMEEKKILIEELSIERDNANHLQIVEEMMTSKLEEVSADAHNLRVENEQLRSSLSTAVQEKQVLGNQLLSAQKEVASLAQECDVASELLVLCEEHEAALVEELEQAKTDFEGEIQASKATENRLVEEVARKSLELRLLQQQFSNLEVTKAKELKDQEAKLSKVETNNSILRLTANELRSALGDRDKKIVKADLVIGELKSEIESLRHDLDRKAMHVAALPSPPEEAEDAQNQHQPPATPTFAMDPQALSSNSQSNPQSTTRQEGPTNSLRTYPIPTVVSDRPYSSRPHSSRTSRWVASQDDGILELGAGSPQYTNSSYPASYGNGWRGGRGRGRGRRWHGGGYGGNPPYDH